ncbi:MAG TPA: ABC transporter permease [Thermoanaerobaculia bacterium]|jgi:putative ABC transport system permease protein
MLSDLLRDLRLALRGLRRRPGFAAAFVATLALGIGANTAIFTVVRAVLLRPLPFTGADRLVGVYSVEPGSDRQPFSIADFLDLRSGARSFEFLIAWGGWSANLTGVDEPVALKAQWTSAGFFGSLGVGAALGRTPSAEEERPGAARVALLGDGLWRSRFGADPAVLGRVLTLNGEPYTVIGVLPPTFPFFASGAELVSPLSLETDPRRARRASGFLRALGRLRPGVGMTEATAELDPIVARLRAAYPDTNAGKQGVHLEPLAELLVGNYRRMLLLLQAAVAIVLLIACTNLANLLLARTAARRPELALRAALGARRRDLLRQLLVETVTLAILGGALGLLVAVAGIRGLLALGPPPPRAAEIGMDLPVLLFTVGLSLAAALGLGLAPALQGSGWGLADGLRGVGRGSIGGRRARARSVLVAAEVGLSLVLLVGAGLLLRTLHRLRATDPGFRADHLLTLQLSLPKGRYATPEAIARFADQASARLSELPGVAAVSAASINPLTQWRANIAFTIVGRADIEREKAPSANYRAIAPGYFRTLGVPLLSGRDVDAHDLAASTPVAVISRTLAQRHFPDRSPIGERLEIDDQPWRTVEIVGVVGDVRSTGLDAEPTADVYVPYAQAPPDVSVWLANIFCLAVRTQGAPELLIPAVQREIRALDRDVATSAARPMEDAFVTSLAERRFHTLLLEIFGAAALALALAGIYALTAFGVIERTREIGVRLSLGSTRGRILALIVRQALRPVAIGLAGGLAAALALSRLLSGLLVGVAPNDAATLCESALVLALAALAASLLPALRATRIDPVRALRAG